MSLKYLPLRELTDQHERNHGIFPVFSKIRKVNGKTVGMISGYCDNFGNIIVDYDEFSHLTRFHS